MDDAGPHMGIVFGVPRSGTSWLGQIINSSPDVAYRFQPLHSYSYPESLSPHSGAAEVREFFGRLATTEEPYVTQRAGYTLGGVVPPSFHKRSATHIVFKEVHCWQECANAIRQTSDVRLVGIVRDPIRVLDSWVSNPNEFEPTWAIRDEWRWAPRKNAEHPGNLYGLEAWLRIAGEMTSLSLELPDQLLLLRYESLVADPEIVTTRVFEHLGLALTDQTRDFLRESTQRQDANPYGVHRRRDRNSVPLRSLPGDIAAQARQIVLDAGLGSLLD